MQYVIREAAGPDACRERHASTDVYCAELRRSRVRYPLLLIGVIIATGVLAFALAGFVGYFNCTLPYTVNGQPVMVGGKLQCWHDPWYPVLYLKEPWPLYLWFSALMILIQVSILRHHLRRLIMTLVITIASILIVAVVYLLGVDAVVRYLLKPPDGLLYQPLTYTVLNFGIILAFIIDSGRRWIGYRKTELSPASMQELMSVDPNRSVALKRAKMGELISGDLIAGMILCGVLSIVFTEPFIRGFLSLAASNVFACGVATAPNLYPCPVPGPHNVLFIQGAIPVLSGHYIAVVDSFLAGLCFVPGVAVLANTAFIRGLNPLAGTTGHTAHHTMRADGDAGDVTAEVGMAVLNALREALERYILPYARRAVLSLRNILWPLLILIGSFSFALGGRFIQYYLHHFDPAYITAGTCSPTVALKSCHPTDPHSYLELALIFTVIGFLSPVFSAALLMMSSRIVSNNLRLMARIGFVVLLTFWMFSFALFGFNWFLIDTGIVPPSLWLPAPQSTALCQAPSWQIMLAPPSSVCGQPFSLWWLSGISFAALLVSIAVLVFRMRTGFSKLIAGGSGRATAPGAVSTSR